MLRAITAAKRKNDKIDAGKIVDCLRCDFLPECHMASTEIRDRRRILRYRNLVLRQAVQMKNRVSGLLMETGVSDNKLWLHRMGNFAELMSTQRQIKISKSWLVDGCGTIRAHAVCDEGGHNRRGRADVLANRGAALAGNPDISGTVDGEVNRAAQ